MRLHNASHNGTGDEIFMNFASGGQQDEHNNTPAPNPNAGPPQETPTNYYEDPLDDVFGSPGPSSPTRPSPPPPNHSGLSLPEPPARRGVLDDPSDIPRIRRLHVTAGYREGLSASKEQHVQAGFDEGYSLGAELGMKVGWVVGVLEGCVRAVHTTTAVHRAAATVDAGDGGEDGEGGEGQAVASVRREEVKTELAQAKEDLSMRRLFGEEFFGGDGVWTYPVPGTEGEGDGEGEESVTFAQIAAAHPLIVKWEGRVRELADGVGLRIG